MIIFQNPSCSPPLCIRRPHSWTGFAYHGILTKEADEPEQYVLSNVYARYVFEESAGGVRLKEFQRNSQGANVWSNEEPALWKAVIWDSLRPFANGLFSLEAHEDAFSTAGVQTDTDGQEITFTWTEMKIGPDYLTVTVTVRLENDQEHIRANISAQWKAGVSQHALDCICVLPLKIAPHPDAALLDRAVTPNFFGAEVENPVSNLMYNYAPRGGTKFLFVGKVRNVITYPNGRGYSMGTWGYYDPGTRDGWQVHLEDHSYELMSGAFQGDSQYMVWEMLCPQPDYVTVGNGTQPLGIGYTVCLRPFQALTGEGWWDIGHYYKQRLDATQPYFRRPPWPDREDLHQFERRPQIPWGYLYGSQAFGAVEAGKEVEATVSIDEIRDALDVGIDVPFFGTGTPPHSSNIDSPFGVHDQTRKMRRALLLLRGKNVFVGIIQPDTFVPRNYTQHQLKESRLPWVDKDLIHGTRVSRHGILRGGDPATDFGQSGPADNNYYAEKTLTVTAYDSANKIVTVSETLVEDDWTLNGSWIAYVPGNLTTDSIYRAEVIGNGAANVPDPTHQIKFSSGMRNILEVDRNPQPGDSLVISRHAQECYHALINSSYLQDLIMGTWGGANLLFGVPEFYWDVHTHVMHGHEPWDLSCSGTHEGWGELDSSYVPHPQGGGSWFLQSLVQFIDTIKQTIRNQHDLSRNTPIARVFSEHTDETVLPQIEGSLHMISAAGLWRP